jgi:hypothetical protein
MSSPKVAGPGWTAALTLDANRQCVDGHATALADAIRRGADLRIYTEFRFNEHIAPGSDNSETVQEVSELRATYLVDDAWAAGIMTLRQPVAIPGFGPRPSMSLFAYNQDGQQAIARLYLDGPPSEGVVGPAAPGRVAEMPKYHQFDNWDAGSNAPSHNFVYEFDVYRFFVRDDWREVFSHTELGEVIGGSIEELVDEFAAGAEVKIGIRGLCSDLSPAGELPLDHEVFIQTGSGYYRTGEQVFLAGSHPVVRCAPGIPLTYASRNWDYGWLIAQTDGVVHRSLVDPYALTFSPSERRHSIRWFVR